MESVLENIFFEVHQTKQKNSSLKKEVTGELETLKKTQNKTFDLIACITTLSTDIQKCFNQFDNIR